MQDIFFDTESEFEEDDLELAQMALNRGDNHAALELAEEYLEQNPFNVEALNLCAIAASKEGDDDNALLLFRKALKIEPQNGAVHHNFAAWRGSVAMKKPSNIFALP